MCNMATSKWIADGAHGNLASTAANWDTPPAAGRDILFDASSVVNCTFDIALALGAYLQDTGYSGVVTQTASFSVTSWLIKAGTFTPTSTYTLSCAGNFGRTGGAITYPGPRLIQGTGTFNVAAGIDFNDYRVTGAVTMSGYPDVIHAFQVDVGAELTIAASATPYVQLYAGSTFVNNGKIHLGASSLFSIYARANQTIGSLGTIDGTGTLRLYLHSDASASFAFTASADWAVSCPMSILSNHASNVLTVDLSASNYILSAPTITFGARVTFNGRASQIRCTTLIVNGASTTVTQGGFLIVEGTATVSNGTWAVNENATVDALVQDGGTITVASGKVLYYEKTLSQTGGSSTGTIAQFQGRKQPMPSRPVDVTNL
jgi:hypothetical protein